MVTLDFVLLKKAAIAAFLDLNFDTAELFTVYRCLPFYSRSPNDWADNTPRPKAKSLAGIVVNDDVTTDLMCTFSKTRIEFNHTAISAFSDFDVLFDLKLS
ncbi:hypothetical protein AJO04nite_26110 [Acinetobacter johnsonii]|uniref:Uncharacterized protein n=1 Tax=Acinetobacter johnsonii TaxID=40214 RepID=A0AAV3WGA5_ACIJO|nr:hypothetical protein AJO04nite_26110 [Acinetobacter johnsonii]